MFNKFAWTEKSQPRLSLLRQYEPIQPFLFVAFSEATRARFAFDVGANVGAYSLFSTLVTSIEQVHAFEVEPTALEELRGNISLNALESRVIVHEQAASSSSGRVEFLISAPMAGVNAVATTTIHRRELYPTSIAVDAIALDDHFGMRKNSLALKIDVEGHEIDVLRGMRGLIEGNSCVIQAESYNNKQELIAALAPSGYRLIFEALNDLYFSNHEALLAPEQVVQAIEVAAAHLIRASRPK